MQRFPTCATHLRFPSTEHMRTAAGSVGDMSNESAPVVVVEDHNGLRRALVHGLSRALAVRVTSCATAGEMLTSVGPETRVLLTDLHLGEDLATTHIAPLRAFHPHLAVIVMSAHPQPGTEAAVLSAGASAVVSKSEGLQSLIEAVRGHLVGS